ncbi:MAG TPA: ATP-dependent DNA helicase RecG [Candidatus Methylacidiphilales bacterium]|jgi:ATP-dependent DNA helicase RecG|nr:ATP-dependent DNA helicase RecG [Candidatus Methylacidiphilales bacterium]
MPADSPAPISLAAIHGIGPKHAESLAKLGLLTHDDLLHFVPRRYEDRRHLKPVSAAQEGQAITVRGKIHHAKAVHWGSLRLEITVAPQTLGNRDDILIARWYGFRPYGIKGGAELFLFARIDRDKKGRWVMNNPDYEIIHDDAESYIHIDRIAPIYNLTEGLSQRVLRRIMFEATQKTAFSAPEFYPAPERMMPRAEAFRVIHFPESFPAEERARQRLAYDEFFVLQCIVAQRRARRVQAHRDRPAATGELRDLSARWLASLPFPLTNAQRRVMAEIDADLNHGPPMNRLLQGDVGSGKTLVAVYAMLRAVEAGEQAALMAPTQILAEQHALNLRRWLEPLGIRVDLFTGNTKGRGRKADRLQGGELDLFSLKGGPSRGPATATLKSGGSVVVGTHALLYDRYAADKLGLVVIDEQHKFGVLQRLALSRKGRNPDILVMTATPIPRTLGMTVYGDLDVSILDELPPGRQPIVTKCRSVKELDKFWAFLLKQIGEGRQAYVIYPLVEESEKVDAKSVKAEFERLKALLPQTRLGLLHGQLDAAEKERVMTAFRAGEIEVLVSTSVIEVGVDVPNATVMLIENAERFGLAQLHQLRGRIGRGEHPSWCVLVGEPKSLESWKRLRIMEETTDGFRIAEEDFKIRGPGNIFGTEQSGLPPLRFASLETDFELLKLARNDAARFLKDDPTLAAWPGLREKMETGGIAAVSLVTVS